MTNAAFSTSNDDLKSGMFNNNIVTKIPAGEGNALVCKFLKNQDGKPYLYTRSFPHKIGPASKDTRSHPCRKALGLGESPELDFHRSVKDQIRGLVEAGKGDSEECKQLRVTEEKFRPKNGGYLFFLEPGTDQIKALKVSASVLNQLYGRDATQYTPAVPSLVDSLNKQGMHPYVTGNPEKDKTGWVKIWKEGEGIGTRYHVKLSQASTTAEVNGKTITYDEPVTYQLGEKISSGNFTAEDYPNPVEFEKKFVWEEADCKTFVESLGTVVPESALPNYKNTNAAGDETVQAGNIQVTDAPVLHEPPTEDQGQPSAKLPFG